MIIYRLYKIGRYWIVKKRLNLCGKYVALGVAAIWDKRKGLEDMVALADKLGEGYQVTVVGVTPEQKEKLPANVIGITRTNSVEELRELYAIADVFVNPTYEDNYPTTNLEARACGTPVITYRTGGSPEAADVVVEKGNVDEMISYLTHSSIQKRKNHEISVPYMVEKYMKMF